MNRNACGADHNLTLVFIVLQWWEVQGSDDTVDWQLCAWEQVLVEVEAHVAQFSQRLPVLTRSESSGCSLTNLTHLHKRSAAINTNRDAVKKCQWIDWSAMTHVTYCFCFACHIQYVIMDHSLKMKIDTSPESYIHTISIDVWFVVIKFGWDTTIWNLRSQKNAF